MHDELLNIFRHAAERKIRRDWGRDAAGQPMDFAAAVEKTAEVLREQWPSALTAENAGHLLLAGFALNGEYFTDFPPTDTEIEAVVEQAKTDFYAYMQLRFLIAFGFCPSSVVLGQWNRGFAAGLIPQPPRPKGLSKVANLLRDYLLVRQLKSLEEVGFVVSRNDATSTKNSACDIVSKATHLIGDGRGMTYEAVLGVWRRQERLPRSAALANAFAVAMLSALPPLLEK